jgi:hypothetical protein
MKAVFGFLKGFCYMKYVFKIVTIFLIYNACLGCSNQRKVVECPINLSDFKIVQDPQKVITGLRIYNECAPSPSTEIFQSKGKWSFQEDGATSVLFEGNWKIDRNKVITISKEFGFVTRTLYINSEGNFYISSIRQ